MTVFSCAPDWESMLTCIYEAWSSRLGHNNVRLELEPLNQLSLFDNYTHVVCDYSKAESVMDSVITKISSSFYRELSYTAMAYEPDVLDVIYRMMILGFAYGPSVTDRTQYKVVTRYHEINTRLGKEACRFIECVRFHEIQNSLYVAHIEPKSRLLITLGPAFEDRMPSENWMIVDDIHSVAVIHPKDEHFYLRTLDNYELNTLLETERRNDEYTDLWKVFFDSIAIKERENYRLQRNLFPLWTRKHATEFL